MSLQSSEVSKVIWALANRHKEILECRFPHYRYKLNQYPDYWICVETQEDTTVLTALFTAVSINIGFGRPYGEHSTIVDYADPRFTDDTICDILERLENDYYSQPEADFPDAPGIARRFDFST